VEFLGRKKKQLYTDFISQYIPNNIKTYIEPFGGTFSVSKYIVEERKDNPPQRLIYNDMNIYPIDICADEIYHLDYKEIFKKFDTKDTIFYLDPPYYKKEHIYDGCENYTKDFHIELYNEIKKLKGDVIISYNNNRFICELYKDFQIKKYSGDVFKFRDEIIILNK